MESLTKKELSGENPRKNGGVFSYLTFSWVMPILLKGRKKELGMEDLYQPLKDQEADKLGTSLEKAWEEEVKKKRSKNKKPSLLAAGLNVFGFKILFLGCILLTSEMLFKVTTPIFLGGIVKYYTNKETSNISEAYWYSGGIIACSFFAVMTQHALMLTNLTYGMKIRLSACSMIYRKSLKLSKTALINTTSGQVVNLLSNDVGRFDLIVMFVHYLWVGPVCTVVIAVLMYNVIGISAIAGVVFMLMFIPFQFYLGKKTSQLRMKTALRTDERVRLMNEIIQGIQVIKMYAWEKPFSRIVSLARQKEIKVIRYVSWIRGILLSFIIFSSRTSTFTSLVMFALLGNVVTADKAFVITAYYNVLRQTMTIFFPQAIGMLAETLVSVRRLEKYMLYDELDRDFQSISRKSKKDKEGEKPSKENGSAKLDPSILQEPGVIMDKVNARWSSDSPELTLSNIDLRVQPTTAVAVIGKVGAGKSSLIQTILGELPIEGGHIKVNGIVSYAAQEPWLFSGSIRQNILFGEEMDKERYRAVIKACSLTRDIELWPDGDKTVVGERGMSLSGGQKARINLARAVYRQADVYLLDDPLSAVDAHVGRHLFDNCIKDFLKDKIVILVTHQLQYLPTADQIVILDHGVIEGVGTYESLRDSGLDFAKLLPKGEEVVEEDASLHRSISRTSKDSRMAYRRQESVVSFTSKESEMEDLDDFVEQAQPEEKRGEGRIGMTYYKAYFKAAGGYFITIIVISFFILAQLCASVSDYFLSYWVAKEEYRGPTPRSADLTNLTTPFTEHFENENATFIDRAIKALEDLVYDRNIDIYIFSALTVGTVLITLSRSFMFFNVAMRASRSLHDAMFSGISRASMYFFNTNPSGRILNRFSKDIGQIDEILPSIMIDVVQIFLSLAGIVVVIAIVNPFLLVPTVIIAILFYFLRKFYLMSSRNLKRMEATTRSPIYSHLAATLNGLSTIRAFEAEKILALEFDNHQDLNTSAYYLFIASARAFGFWLDSVLVIYIAIVVLSFFLMGNSGGNVGLAITQALGLTGMVQWGMRQSAELENTMTAVERVVEYNTVDPEPEFESSPENKPPEEWPEKGKIKFDKMSMSYFPDAHETVLNEIDIEINPREKIGIVGRTGAGKSSIINALFRLSYNNGHIYIDARDTKMLGLHDLRSKISIIPQEPVLFSGSMRYNLDPFDEFADDKLWSALDEVNLKQFISEMPAGLNTKISEGGTNFSVGQRQLVCLARAILRENKILLMDEATANVDPQTDALIQNTIRQKFAECTVLTIAHRLNTVVDSDRILVMDAGRVVEFAPPHELLMKSNETKVFYNMLKETGKSTFESLKKLAEENYLKRKQE